MNFNFKTIGIIVAVILILTATYLFFQSDFGGQNKAENKGVKNSTTKINDETFELEVADTPEEREKGLSGRRSLGDNEGMLFLFDTPGLYAFWMKDMRFPIDILFINGERIVTVYSNVPPPTSPDVNSLPQYTPTQPADKVLELKAGQAEKLGLRNGGTIDLPTQTQ